MPRAPHGGLVLEPPAAAMPVLLRSQFVDVDTESPKLRDLPQTALQLREARKTRQPHHVVPQCERLVSIGKPADDRAEEGHSGGWFEVDDGSPHVLARQSQGLVGLRLDNGSNERSSSASARSSGRPHSTSAGSTNCRVPRLSRVGVSSSGLAEEVSKMR